MVRYFLGARGEQPYPMRLHLSIIAGTVLALAAGAGHARETSAEVFRAPEIFVGQQVTVCGYMPDIANIRQRRRQTSEGLAVESVKPETIGQLRDGKRRKCLEGTIFATGCGNEICSGWIYPFGISIQRVSAR